jgi:hypothetical protein
MLTYLKLSQIIKDTGYVSFMTKEGCNGKEKMKDVWFAGITIAIKGRDTTFINKVEFIKECK